MYKYIFLIIFCFFCKGTFAQDSLKKSSWTLIASPGISLQHQVFAEFNLMYINDEDVTGGPCAGGFARGPRVGIEMNFNKNNLLFAPKIGYELSGMVLCLRANAVCYFGKTKTDLRLLPEIGLSLGGAINICYGYGFSVLKNRLDEVSKSRFTLTFNISKDLWSQLK